MDILFHKTKFFARLSAFAGAVLAAGVCFYIFLRKLGGPFMFSLDYAPATAADPQRDLHVAMSWIIIYGTIGLIAGFIYSIGYSKPRYAAAAASPVIMFLLLRSYGKISFIFTEEGRLGIPIAIAMSFIGSFIWFILYMLTHKQLSTVKN